MKTIIVTILLLLSLNCFSQPFLEMGLTTNRAVNLGAGYRLDNGVNVGLVYEKPFFKEYGVKRLVLSLGGEIPFSDENPFYIMPMVGLNYWQQKSIQKIGKVNSGVLPLYGLSFGKQWYRGQLFISGYFSNGFYFGAGIRAFIK